MRASPVLLGLSLSSSALGLSRRNTLQRPNTSNGTAPQPKRYIIEFEPVCKLFVFAKKSTRPKLIRSDRARTTQRSNTVSQHSREQQF